jgi:hypothetical protein
MRITSTTRTVLVTVCTISSLASFVSLFYLVVNIIEVPKQVEIMRMIAADSTTNNPLGNKQDNKQATAKTSDEKNDNLPLPLKIYNFFRKISIDLSAVTPFVLLWFFYSNAKSSWGILKNKITETDISTKPTFPFTRNYETYWVQLGLIGTIWGFLIIGIKMGQQSKVDKDILDILVKAYGTALLSTFTGVVAAYIFAPVTKKFYGQLLNIKVGENAESSLLANQINALANGFNLSANAISKLTAEVENLKKNISTLSPTVIQQSISMIEQKVDSQLQEFKKIAVNVQGSEEHLKGVLEGINLLPSKSVGKLNELINTNNKVAEAIISGFRETQDELRRYGEFQQAFIREMAVKQDETKKNIELSGGSIINAISEYYNKIKAEIEAIFSRVRELFDAQKKELRDITTGKQTDYPSKSWLSSELHKQQKELENGIDKIALLVKKSKLDPQGGEGRIKATGKFKQLFSRFLSKDGAK